MPALSRKVCVVGGRLVGKLLLTLQFCEERFVDQYYPTIENEFLKELRFRDTDYCIEIIDTAGQDELSIMNQKHLVGVHGYVLVYLITLRLLFDVVSAVRDKILNSTGTNSVPMVLVGNKTDLEESRQVEYAEGEALAKEFGCAFVETSAKLGGNVAEAFDKLVAEVEGVKGAVEKDAACVVM